MAKSYRNIDYRLRAAKFVERALFVEAFKRTPFFRLEDYQYIGLGSLYFADFRLFHKHLGIQRMTSIEGCIDDRDRFNFNKPFSCLEMKYGMTWDILPTLNFDVPALMWLDYDGTLSDDILSDIRFASNNCNSGSFFSLTINTNGLNRNSYNNDKENAVDRLSNIVGKDRLPPDIKPVDLSDKGTATVFHKIMLDEINSVLSTRNARKTDDEKIKFQQIFHIRYKDGAPMLTFGGFYVSGADTGKFESANYEEQIYFRSEFEALSIDVPLLTHKERLELEQLVPNIDIENIEIDDVVHNTKAPKKEVLNYFKHYRFLPNFANVEQL